MTLDGLAFVVGIALGAGAVVAYRPLVDALMRWRWLTGDDAPSYGRGLGPPRSHVRVVRDDERGGEGGG